MKDWLYKKKDTSTDVGRDRHNHSRKNIGKQKDSIEYYERLIVEKDRHKYRCRKRKTQSLYQELKEKSGDV